MERYISKLQERLSKDLESFKDELIDIYDVNQLIVDITKGEWKSHIWKDMAIITSEYGSGLILDYEAIGRKFESLDELMPFDISHPDVEEVDADGNKHISMSMYPEARIKLSAKSIMENAPKRQEKAGEFFKKCYGYNMRCESNLEDALKEIQDMGHFDSEDIVENINEDDPVGLKIAKIVQNTFTGDCGPVGGEAPYRKANKVGLWSQNRPIWYTFNDDGSVDVDNREYNKDFLDDEDKEEDHIHYDSVLDLIDGKTADGWFLYFQEEIGGPEASKQIHDIIQFMGQTDELIEEYDRITKEDEDWLDKQIDNHGFKIVSKRDYGFTKPLTDVHYQIISKEGNKTEEDLEKEVEWIDSLLDKFEDRTGSPCTYNMGLQFDGFISCGFDCRATSNKYKDQLIESDESTDDDLFGEPEHKISILICDGNGAASRGLEKDKFYVFETKADDLEHAVNKLADDIDLNICNNDYAHYVEECEEQKEKPESFYDWLNGLDPTGGDPFIASFIDNGKREDLVYMDDVTSDDFDKPELAHLFIDEEEDKRRKENPSTAEQIRQTIFAMNKGEIPYEKGKKIVDDLFDKLRKESQELKKQEKISENLNLRDGKIHLEEGDTFVTNSEEAMPEDCWLNADLEFCILDASDPNHIKVRYDSTEESPLNIHGRLDYECPDVTLAELEEEINIPGAIVQYNGVRLDKDTYIESLVDNVKDTILVPTGLYGEDDKRILDSLMGQLSDGIWENSNRMQKYWQYMKPVIDEKGEIFIKVPKSYNWYLDLESQNDIRKFFAVHLKQMVKKIQEWSVANYEWKRDNTTQFSGYFHSPEPTVQDVYRVYDKLLGRKDRINKDEYIEELNEASSNDNIVSINDAELLDFDPNMTLYRIKYNSTWSGYVPYVYYLHQEPPLRVSLKDSQGAQWYDCPLFFESEKDARDFLNKYSKTEFAKKKFQDNLKEKLLQIYKATLKASNKFNAKGFVKLNTNFGNLVVQRKGEFDDLSTVKDFVDKDTVLENKELISEASKYNDNLLKIYDANEYTYKKGDELSELPGGIGAMVTNKSNDTYVEDIEKHEKLKENLENKIKDIINKYDAEETSRIKIFEVDPDKMWIEHFDDGDIDFSKFTEHEQKDYGDNTTGSKYYSFMITGGLNGSGEWDDYLEDIKKIFIELKDKLNLEPVLYNVDTDIADDVWTGKVFLYEKPTTKQLDECLLRALEEDIEVLIENRVADSEFISNTLDNFLQDMAQMYADISYGDIVEFEHSIKSVDDERTTSLKKLYRKAKEAEVEDELIKIASDIEKLVKGKKPQTVTEDIEKQYFLCSVYGGYNCEELLADNIEIYANNEEQAKKEAIKSYKKEYNYSKKDNPFGLKAEIVSDDEYDELEEDIEKHDTLNPKLFDGEELKPEVRETVEKIADEFVKELANDGIKFDLKDIVLLGSNVSYNYNKDSDLDIHLIADSKNLHCPDELYPLLYSAYRSMFNHNYNITIHGIPAELYVEMDSAQAKSNGIYSLKDGWLKKPVQTNIPDLDKEAFDKLFTEWEDKYFELLKSVGKEELSEILHPEIDLGWIGKGKRHLVDADTFTTKKDGDIISIHISDDLPDLKYKIMNGSYLDDEAREDSPYRSDDAIEIDYIRDSADEFADKLDDMIESKVEKAILDLLRKEYKQDFAFHRGGTTNGIVPMGMHLYAKHNRTIPDILGDKDEVVESLTPKEKKSLETCRNLFELEELLGRKPNEEEYKVFLYPKMLKLYDKYEREGYSRETIRKELIDAYYYDDLVDRVMKEKDRNNEPDAIIESNLTEERSDDIYDFITELYNLRKESIANEGEYGLGNLVFKEFRNLGYLDNLRQLRKQAKSKELSLEELSQGE